jgi:FdhD protein
VSTREFQGLGAAHVSVRGRRWQASGLAEADEQLAEEVPVAFVYNGVPFAVMLATPLDLEDFALGFSLTERVIASPEEFQGIEVVPEKGGFTAYVSVPKARSAALGGRQRAFAGRTGCGLCGEQMLEEVLRPVPEVRGGGPFRAEALQAAEASLAAAQQLNAITGAVHAAAWADAAGRVHVLREDVGRHNALDKLIGALVRSGADRHAGFVVVTSRASYEMVHKTAVAGLPLLAAVSAPTALAVRVAEDSGVTLVGFTRQGRHTVYANPGRLVA